MNQNAVGNSEPEVLLWPLGTGAGATSVYEGKPSSAFVISVDGEPRILVDAGHGVIRQCVTMFGCVPRLVYVSHNHTDHAADLPVALIKEMASGRQLTVVAAPEVSRRLREHRIHELYSTGLAAEQLANWLIAPPGIATSIDDEFAVVTHRGKHSEESYGFVLRFNDRPIAGFTADSGFDADFYRKLCEAPIVLVDARQSGSLEHASFEEIATHAESLASNRLYVTGYGNDTEAHSAYGLRLVRIGESIKLL